MSTMQQQHENKSSPVPQSCLLTSCNRCFATPSSLAFLVPRPYFAVRSLTSKSCLPSLSVDTVGVNRFLPPPRSQLGVGRTPSPTPRAPSAVRTPSYKAQLGRQCIELKRTSCSIRFRVPLNLIGDFRNGTSVGVFWFCAKKSGAEEKSLTDGVDGMAGVEGGRRERKGFQSVPRPY